MRFCGIHREQFRSEYRKQLFYNDFESYALRSTVTSPRGQWVDVSSEKGTSHCFNWFWMILNVIHFPITLIWRQLRQMSESCHLTKSTEYKINLDWLSYSLSIKLIFWRSDGVKITRIWYEMMNIWDTVSTFIHLHRMFLPTDNLFEQRIGQFTLAHLYIILHNILSEINKSVPGLVTYSPYGVWGRELTTCHLGNHIRLTVRFMFQSDSWCIQ